MEHKEPKTIRVRVKSQSGHCEFGHKVGDQIVFDGEGVTGRICLHSLYSILPKVFAMRYNADFPWRDEGMKASHACPDAVNPVVYELWEG